ncbi:subclass B1 metallo-beta-lactamase [Shewanella woodyi]|uniref:beta-lactamase n=1 Tax=Shewanella woodyi (strain ATCC 51908 / MS32) TaxID=392500 RepID=B1KD24_SHEWM|nr:subclass B1 metallo-beta-lactamase [Shewanella woodyi]ACA87859.1 Beta-lactamase [Shewanella woodyi ATCC 51908]
MSKQIDLFITKFKVIRLFTHLLPCLFLLGVSSITAAAPSSSQVNWSSELIKITQVYPTLYLVKSYKTIKLYQDKPAQTFDSNSFIYVDNSDAYLIDTPWSESDMPDLMRWLEVKKLQLKGTIVTHYHQDRAGGLGYLDRLGSATYASKMTNKLLVNDKQPTSNHSFSGDKFALLKGKIEAFYPGSGHSMDNLVIWLPEEKVIVGGCLLKDNKVNNLGWTGDADLANWYHSISKVKAEFPKVEFIFPGHGEGAKGQSILDHSLSVTKEVARFE